MILNSVENYKCLTNRVLIKIDKQFNNKLKLGDTEILLDTTYDPEMHTVAKGVIESVCDTLHMGKSPSDMEWSTTVQVKKGDEVYFTWMAVAEAFAKGEQIVVANDSSEGDVRSVYIPAMYKDLTLAVIDNSVVMLNGYVLVEAINFEDLPSEIQTLKTDIILTGSFRKKASPQWGKVVDTGVPNTAYVEKVYSDNADVSPGDIVLFQKDSDIAVQYDLHADLLGRKKMFKIQRRNLLATFNK